MKAASKIKVPPKGIKELWKLKLNGNSRLPSRKFNRLVLRLEKCAGDGNGKRVRCDSCPYLQECRERFDAICG